jgi:hypothetical protein
MTDPIDMILFCTQCGRQHLDEPQPEKNWDNPPHRSHECQHCGHVWRPADVPTNGVAEIKTKGLRDHRIGQFKPYEQIRCEIERRLQNYKQLAVAGEGKWLVEVMSIVNDVFDSFCQAKDEEEEQCHA